MFGARDGVGNLKEDVAVELDAVLVRAVVVDEGYVHCGGFGRRVDARVYLNVGHLQYRRVQAYVRR